MTTSRLSLPQRLIAICVLVLSGLAFGAVLFEIVVRLFFPVSDFFWQWDPVIGMKLVPGKHGRSIRQGIYDVSVEANSAGFRDREHTTEKSAGTQRIVLLGDSFLEAIQVPFDQSITPRLEDRLQHMGFPAEVISLGVSGFGTGREYLALREYGLQYKPDLVLLFFVGNDISDNSRRLQGLSYVPYPQPTADGDLARDSAGHPLFTPFADQSSRLSFMTDVLRNHSKGYRVFREMTDSSPRLHALLYRLRLMSTPPETVNAPSGDNFGFYEIYRLEPKPAWSEAWQLTEQMLLAVRDLAHQNGAEFGVVLIPAAWEVYPQLWNDVLTRLPLMREAHLSLELPSGRLSTFLSSHDVPVMNLLPDFRSHVNGTPPLYVRSDAHWTADGHRLAVDLLAQPVASLLSSKAGRAMSMPSSSNSNFQ